MPSNERNHRIRPFDPAVHFANRSKQILWLQWQTPRGSLDFMRQHVEQHLGVTIGIDMAVVGVEQFGLECVCVGQITVVHQHDTEWRVHIEGLRLFFAEGVACRRVAHLTEAAVAR